MAATTQAAFEDISQPAPQSVWVNGNEITAQAVLAEMQSHPPASAEAAHPEPARALVVREPLLRPAEALRSVAHEPAAAAHRPSATPAEALLRPTLARTLKTPTPSQT